MALRSDDDIANDRTEAELTYYISETHNAQARAEDAESLGKLVREVWVAYCLETGDTKPSHIAQWEELSEHDKEADRRIGLALARHILGDLF